MKPRKVLTGALIPLCALILIILVGSPSTADPPFDPPGLDRALEAQAQHTDALLRIGGVVGTAVGHAADGSPAVLIFTERPGVAGVPASLDGVPVVVEATGKFFALHHRPGHEGGGDVGDSEASAVSTTASWPRPVPIGVSTGNINECSAGTIGARVTKNNNVYALSNNHVYARENLAAIGEKVVQPGGYDTACSINEYDAIGTLADFEPINFNCTCFIFCVCDSSKDNWIDAAKALSSVDKLGKSTPSDGYGTPKSATVTAVVGQKVQKYGRTSSLTRGGKVDGFNATVLVNYISGVARFQGQIIVRCRCAFSKPGDSGSLVVTDPGKNPVGLLFAGNSSGKTAILNPIGKVLTRFGAAVDGEGPP